MDFLVPQQDIVLNNDDNVIIKFQIPFEIKNDIIYCQKAMRTYLKVHQLVLNHFGERVKWPTLRKLIDDLEREIYEMNAEQRFLIYRLRRSLEEFYISLPINGDIIDRDSDNTFLRHSFSKYVDDPHYPCDAISVKSRRSFNQWKRKFGLDDPSRNVFETKFNTDYSVPMIPLGITSRQRVSLLKPKSERLIIPDGIMQMQMQEIEHKTPTRLNENKNNTDCNEAENNLDDNEIKEENLEVIIPQNKPSPAMNNSRMKLLQALNKAKTQKEIITPVASGSSSAYDKSPTKSQQEEPKQSTSKLIFKPAPVPKLMPKYIELSSSSDDNDDDSMDGITEIPILNEEQSEPCEYNKENFLKLFNLYSLEQSAYMNQRRSKRRRRNVQINEHKDYHYGALNLAAIDAARLQAQKEKKKKVFLASPPSNRNLKRRRSDKYVDNNKMSRSSTVSPDNKILCNECSKNGDSGLSHCETCKHYFHAKCHTGPILKKALIVRQKICPSCLRLKKSSSISSEEQNRSRSNTISPNSMAKIKDRRQSSILIDECCKLKAKMVRAQSRRSSLLKEGEKFKTKMNKLLNIVDTIKNDIHKDSTSDNPVYEIDSDEDSQEMKSVSKSSSKSSSTSNDETENAKKDSKVNEIQELEDTDTDDDEVLVIREDSVVIEIKDSNNDD